MTHFQPEGTSIPVSKPLTATPRSRRALYVGVAVLVVLGIGIVAGILAHGSNRKQRLLNPSTAISKTSGDAKQFTDDLDAQHNHTTHSVDHPASAAPTTDAYDGESRKDSTHHASHSQQLSRAEQERFVAYESEQAAVDSPLTLPDPSITVAAVPTSGPTEPPDLSQLASLYAAATRAPVLGQPTATEKPKEQPLDQPMPSLRIPAQGKYILPAGTHIKASLTAAVDTELPGMLEAQVVGDIRDRFQNVIIPFGSILLGDVTTRVSFGGNRIAQVWNRIRFPDDSILVLNDLGGHDETGAAGIPGKVNNHIGKLIETAAITTVFAAGIAVSQRQSTSVLASPSVGSTIAQSAGSSLAEANSELVRRSLDIQPTAKLAAGTPLDIPITRDIIVDAPYRPYTYGQANLLSASK